MKISKINPTTQFHFLEAGDDLESFKIWAKQNHISISWFGFLERSMLQKKIYEADLVIGIFKNGALSMNNIESMLLKTSIITYDRW